MSRTAAANIAGLKVRYMLWSISRLGDHVIARREPVALVARSAGVLEGKILGAQMHAKEYGWEEK
jgi:hypothetical protein